MTIIKLKKIMTFTGAEVAEALEAPSRALPPISGEAGEREPHGPSIPASQIPKEQLDRIEDDSMALIDVVGHIEDTLLDIANSIRDKDSYAGELTTLTNQVSALTNSIDTLKQTNAIPDELKELVEGVNNALDKFGDQLKDVNKGNPEVVGKVNVVQSVLDKAEGGLRSIKNLIKTSDMPKIKKKVDSHKKGLRETFIEIKEAFNQGFKSIKTTIKAFVAKRVEQNRKLKEAIQLLQTVQNTISGNEQKLQLLHNYFVQVQQQNLPFQQKMIISRAKKEFQVVIESLKTQESAMLGKISVFDKELEDSVETLQETAGNLQTSGAVDADTIRNDANLAVTKQHEFHLIVQTYKRAMNRVVLSLENIDELLETEVSAKEIGDLTTKIITELANALASLEKVRLAGPGLDTGMRELGNMLNKWIIRLDRVEKSLVPKESIKVDAVSPAAAKPVKKARAPVVKGDIYLRVSANHAKLGFLNSLEYVMPGLIETHKNIKQTFEFLYGFYANFKTALESNDTAMIAKYSSIEKKRLVEHIRFFISLMGGLASGSRYEKKDYEKLKKLVAKAYYETRNRYFANDNVILAIPRGFAAPPVLKVSAKKPLLKERAAIIEEQEDIFLRVRANTTKIRFITMQMPRLSARIRGNKRIQTLFARAYGSYMEFRRALEERDMGKIRKWLDWEGREMDELEELNEALSDFIREAGKSDDARVRKEIKEYQDYLKETYEATQNQYYKFEQLSLL